MLGVLPISAVTLTYPLLIVDKCGYLVDTVALLSPTQHTDMIHRLTPGQAEALTNACLLSEQQLANLVNDIRVAYTVLTSALEPLSWALPTPN